MPSISITGVRVLSFSISGSERRSKIVWMFSALRVWIPAAVTWEGSALRKRRSERVVRGGWGCASVVVVVVVVVVEGASVVGGMVVVG